MKRFTFSLAVMLLTTASASTFAQSTDWKIADDYSVKFDGGGDPSGEFRGLKGDIKFDQTKLSESKFNVTIDVSSINTGNGMKNTHAKGAKWFDAEKYPTISFTSSSISKTASGYEAKGTLSMHGVQKEVAIPFTFSNNVFNASFEVNRLDYNINVEEPSHGAAKFKVNITVHVKK